VSSINKLALPLKREHEEMGGCGEGEIKFSKQDTAEDKEHSAKGIKNNLKIEAQSSRLCWS